MPAAKSLFGVKLTKNAHSFHYYPLVVERARLTCGAVACAARPRLLSAVPPDVHLGLRTQTPECQARVRDSNYTARPLCLGIEVGVPQEAADERSDFILPDACHNDTVAGVPQARLKEVAIPREERGIALSSQQNNNLLIYQTLSAKVKTNLSRRQPPRLKQQALSIKDVLIENNQACARSSTYSGAVYCSE